MKGEEKRRVRDGKGGTGVRMGRVEMEGRKGKEGGRQCGPYYNVTGKEGREGDRREEKGRKRRGRI